MSKFFEAVKQKLKQTKKLGEISVKQLGLTKDIGVQIGTLLGELVDLVATIGSSPSFSDIHSSLQSLNSTIEEIKETNAEIQDLAEQTKEITGGQDQGKLQKIVDKILAMASIAEDALIIIEKCLELIKSVEEMQSEGKFDSVRLKDNLEAIKDSAEIMKKSIKKLISGDEAEGDKGKDKEKISKKDNKKSEAKPKEEKDEEKSCWASIFCCRCCCCKS